MSSTPSYPVGASVAAAVSAALDGTIDRLGRKTALDHDDNKGIAPRLDLWVVILRRRYPTPLRVARNTAAAACELMTGTEIAALGGCSAFASDNNNAAAAATASVDNNASGGGAG